MIEVARRFADRAGLSADAGDRLAVVAEEWIANVVEHGGARADSWIVVRFGHAGDRVRVSVSDAGRPFDPRAAVFTGPDLVRGGGAGLELIRAWSRITGYQRRAGRNRLVLDMSLN